MLSEFDKVELKKIFKRNFSNDLTFQVGQIIKEVEEDFSFYELSKGVLLDLELKSYEANAKAKAQLQAEIRHRKDELQKMEDELFGGRQ